MGTGGQHLPYRVGIGPWALGSGTWGLNPQTPLSVAMTLGGLLATPQFQFRRLQNVNNDI